MGLRVVTTLEPKAHSMKGGQIFILKDAMNSLQISKAHHTRACTHAYAHTQIQVTQNSIQHDSSKMIKPTLIIPNESNLDDKTTNSKEQLWVCLSGSKGIQVNLKMKASKTQTV